MTFSDNLKDYHCCIILAANSSVSSWMCCYKPNWAHEHVWPGADVLVPDPFLWWSSSLARPSWRGLPPLEGETTATLPGIFGVSGGRAEAWLDAWPTADMEKPTAWGKHNPEFFVNDFSKFGKWRRSSSLVALWLGTVLGWAWRLHRGRAITPYPYRSGVIHFL